MNDFYKINKIIKNTVILGQNLITFYKKKNLEFKNSKKYKNIRKNRIQFTKKSYLA